MERLSNSLKNGAILALLGVLLGGCFRSHRLGERGRPDASLRDVVLGDGARFDASPIDARADVSGADVPGRDARRDAAPTIDRIGFCSDLAFRLCRAWDDCGCRAPERVEVECPAFVTPMCREHLWPLEMDEAIARNDIIVDADVIESVLEDLQISASRCVPPFQDWTSRELATFRGGFVGRLPEGADCVVPSRRLGSAGFRTQRELWPNDCASGDCRSVCVPWSPDDVTPVDRWCVHPDYRPYADFFGAPAELAFVADEGRCERPLDNGESCVGFDQCLSWNCEEETCSAPRENGETCSAHVECASRYCTLHRRNSICLPGEAELGAEAETDHQCASNVRGTIGGTCAPRICNHLTWLFSHPWSY